MNVLTLTLLECVCWRWLPQNTPITNVWGQPKSTKRYLLVILPMQYFVNCMYDVNLQMNLMKSDVVGSRY